MKSGPIFQDIVDIRETHQNRKVFNIMHISATSIRRALLLALVSILFSNLSVAEEKPGFIARSTNLQSEASPTSSKLASIAVGTEVNVLSRKGGWYQVSTASQVGWVKFISVRFQSGSAKGSNGLSEAALLLTRDTSPTLTAGVKGLQEEDLNKAKPNMEAVYMIAAYSATLEQALKFAQNEQLRGAQ